VFLVPGQPSRAPGFGLLPADLSHEVTPFSPGETSAAIDARWLADAELVLVALEPIGVFEKQLKIDGFVLPQLY
jgi:hypothetical protein